MTKSYFSHCEKQNALKGLNAHTKCPTGSQQHWVEITTCSLKRRDKHRKGHILAGLSGKK